MKVGFISLGCAKNRVDTEIMIGILKKAGFKIVNTLDQAEIIIINTCGFITEAREEAINTIIRTGNKKEKGRLKYLLATGCLAQRYGLELLDEMPELDGVVGISSFTDIDNIVNQVIEGKRISRLEEPSSIFTEKGPRVLTTPPGSAYLKVAEGCFNRCSYCAIPSIRGPLRSRPLPELVQEGKELVDKGVKELVLIAQDTSRYGWDLSTSDNLNGLLRELVKIKGLEWIRLMYLHPAHIEPELINIVAQNNKILPYFDIPIQHASDLVLKNMNRGYHKSDLYRLFEQLRQSLPDLILRTTVMVGFPGESDDDFQSLYDFVKETQFDWLGTFAFTPEEGTAAYNMVEQIPEEIKKERVNAIMQLQKGITRKKNKSRLNQWERVLISSQAAKNLYIGRGYYQAPEVDGITMVKSAVKLTPGIFAKVQLKGIRNYDIVGEYINEYPE